MKSPWLQLAFGFAQICGATASLLLFLQEGASQKTVALVSITALISLLSLTFKLKPRKSKLFSSKKR